MQIAKGAQLEFWRHLLSLNGIDWESEQVSFSNDDECYTCMPRMYVSSLTLENWAVSYPNSPSFAFPYLQ